MATVPVGVRSSAKTGTVLRPEPVLVHQDPLGPHAAVLAVDAELADDLARQVSQPGDAAVNVDEDA